MGRKRPFLSQRRQPMELLALGLASIAGMVIIVCVFLRHQRSLLDRLQARSLEEFKYFSETYKKDIKRQDKALDKAIEEEEEVDVNAGSETTDKFLRDIEESFDANEIDMEKLKKSIRSEDKE